ncbi:MAG: TRAP transporter small permease [Paracoccaceae bacterium]|nr:TRAP transporter small permease [Paracoccaceae bacterium]
MILDVWLGIAVRYIPSLQLTFTEELARYLMIWIALLAVSSGISYREHIGVAVLYKRFPERVRRGLAVAFDGLALLFFLVVFFYGLGLVDKGFGRVTMIYGIPKAYPYIGVPLAAALASIQLVLVAIHDAMAGEDITLTEQMEV